MNTKSCGRCKGLYHSVGNVTLCPRCRANHEESFQYIKEYLQKYPGTSMPILSEKTGVAIPKIENYLREERIEIAPDSPVMLACSQCKEEIITGMYCDKCSKTMAGELKKLRNTMLANEQQEHETLTGKMHYIVSKRRRK